MLNIDDPGYHEEANTFKPNRKILDSEDRKGHGSMFFYFVRMSLFSLLLTLSLIVSESHSGTEFLPYFDKKSLDDLAEVKRFIEQIHALPFIVEISPSHTERLIWRQNNLMLALAKHDGYMEWAERKKDPVRIEVLKKQDSKNSLSFSTDEISSIMEDLSLFSEPHGDNRLQLSPNLLTNTKNNRIHSYLFDEIFNKNGLNSSNALVVGILSSLKTEDKIKFFNRGALRNKESL